MYTIQTLNAISPVIYNHLPQENFTVSKEAAQPDAVIVRSASMLEMELPGSLLSIARAGAGYNNIPVDKCTAAGICVFNTPGANANAVKELVLAGLLLASRDIIGGVEWAKGLKPGDIVTCIWTEEGVQVISEGMALCQGTGLAVAGSDIYVAGNAYDMDYGTYEEIYRSPVWKNGTEMALEVVSSDNFTVWGLACAFVDTRE